MQPILVNMQIQEIRQEIFLNEDGERNKVVDHMPDVVVEGEGRFKVSKPDI